MKKKVFLLLLFNTILLGGCHSKIIINESPFTINKISPPLSFTNVIKENANYQSPLLARYYAYYLDGYSYYEMLNFTNHPDFLDMTSSYPAITIDNLTLVNRHFYLTKDYPVQNLVKVKNINYVHRPNETMMLNKDTFEAYRKLEKDAKRLSLNILLYSGYRSYQKQLSLWDNNHRLDDLYLAVPGCSEHQTGLAIDVGTTRSGLTNNFEDTPLFLFLQNHAYEYGFILRYPKNKTHITGYSYEPWHYRFVGKTHAKIIYEKQLSLEEYFYSYLELPAQFPI